MEAFGADHSVISGTDTGSSVSADSAFQGCLAELYRSGTFHVADHREAFVGLEACDEP